MGRNIKIIDVPDYWTRERKIEALLPLAEAVSAKWKVQQNIISLDKEDMIAIAQQAIIRAVDEFDASKNPSIVAYARKKARWAIQEALRTHSHATRAMVESGKTVSWLPFSYQSSVEGKTVGEMIAETFGSEDLTEDNFAYEQDRERFYAYLPELPEKQRTVVRYYLQDDMKQKDIAKIMGISESRVLQILRSAMKTMQERLAIDLAEAEAALAFSNLQPTNTVWKHNKKKDSTANTTSIELTVEIKRAETNQMLITSSST